MSPWEQAWNTATDAEKRTTRRWMAGVKHHSALTGDRNQCAACGEFFASSGSFESHRTGSLKKKDRRCLTVPEMLAKGFERNDRFYWITSRNDWFSNAPGTPL